MQKVILLFTLMITLLSQSFAGLPQCYGVSDTSNKMWFMVPNPTASTLPTSREITLAKTYKAEGSAYRASTKQMYLFDCADDNQAPCHLHEYTIDVATGKANYTEVKHNIISMSDGGSVEGATFYLDTDNDMEFLYATVGEDISSLYKWNTKNWSLESGYPKKLSGDTKAITALAYDSKSKKFYGIKDDTSTFKGNSDNPDIYEIDVNNGTTKHISQMQYEIDGEGLAFASDGWLYSENDDAYPIPSHKRRTIYAIDVKTGEMTPAATFSGYDDIESLSCNDATKSDFGDAPTSYGPAVHDIPLLKNPSHDVYLGKKKAEDDASYSNQSTKEANADGAEEDGVFFKERLIQDQTLIITQTITIVAHTSGNTPAFINAWIDFNGDGDFDDEGEQIASNLSGTPGKHIKIQVTIPKESKKGTTYARFRYATQKNLPSHDNIDLAQEASDGEVEDYRIMLSPGGTISGKVLDSDDTPIAQSTIMLLDKDGKNPAKDIHGTPVPPIITDASGSFSFHDIPAGHYFLQEKNPPHYDSIMESAGQDESLNKQKNDDLIPVILTLGEMDSDNVFRNHIQAEFITNEEPIIPTKQMLTLEKRAEKKEVKIGGFVPYHIDVENHHDSQDYSAVYLLDTIPAGFTYVKDSAKIQRDDEGKKTLTVTGKKELKLGTFTLKPKEHLVITYLLRAGTALSQGTHTNRIIAMQGDKALSQEATANVMLIADSMIDNALVIGRVFEDSNRNGTQDKSERGIPGVRLATATGMLIETDAFGRYHIADAHAGQFAGTGSNIIVKVDKASLPKEALFTTENPRVYRVTASGLNVVNFGIWLPQTQMSYRTKVTQKVLVEVEKNISIGSIYFDSDQDCIRPDQVAPLKDIAKKLKAQHGGSIVLEANTDARAPIWYNKKLAYARAKSVHKELRHLLGDSLIKKINVIYDDCDTEVTFNPRYDWWGRPNIPRSKKECTEFGLSKKECQNALLSTQGGAK